MQDLTRNPSFLRAWQLGICCALGFSLACDGKLVIGIWSGPVPADSTVVAGAAGSGGTAGGRGGATAEGGGTSGGTSGAAAGSGGAAAGSGGAAAGSGGAAAGSGGAAASCEEPSAGRSGVSADIVVPWSTGFEGDFCDYFAVGGTCYSHPEGSATHQIVEAPVHSGRYAAAFSVEAGQDVHTRCYLEGKLPKQAYYEAFYYIPAVSKNAELWNLFHFQVRRQTNDSGGLTNLLDVSLENDNAGGLRLFVWSRINGIMPGNFPAIPIGEWFQIRMFMKLAADNSGEIAVYQNGARCLLTSGIQTDFSDSEWGQWYVGNLANNLDPPQSTLYVDDISVRASR